MRLSISLTLLGCLAFAPLARAQEASRLSEPARLLKQADAAFESERYAEAARDYALLAEKWTNEKMLPAPRTRRFLLSAAEAYGMAGEVEHAFAYKAWGYYDLTEGRALPYQEHFRGEAWYKGQPDLVSPSKETRLLLPTVVLTDYDTASAAEDFLIYLDKLPHITRVGRKTYGSTGQPLPLLLPGNISARICAKRDTFPDGRDFVGVGVLPHVEATMTAEDYLANRDVILNKGVSVLQEKMKAAFDSRSK